MMLSVIMNGKEWAIFVVAVAAIAIYFRAPDRAGEVIRALVNSLIIFRLR